MAIWSLVRSAIFLRLISRPANRSPLRPVDRTRVRRQFHFPNRTLCTEKKGNASFNSQTYSSSPLQRPSLETITPYVGAPVRNLRLVLLGTGVLGLAGLLTVNLPS